MGEVETFRDWFEYNRFVRQRYLDRFGELPPEELLRDRGASYRNLLQIHEHLLWVIWAWIKNASNQRIREMPEALHDPPSLDDLRQLEWDVDEAVRIFFEGLTEHDLGRTYAVKEGQGFDRDILLSVRDTLWHLLEEEMQHRGELNALLWQIDAEPPLFSWIDWVQLPKRDRVPRPPRPRSPTKR